MAGGLSGCADCSALKCGWSPAAQPASNPGSRPGRRDAVAAGARAAGPAAPRTREEGGAAPAAVPGVQFGVLGRFEANVGSRLDFCPQAGARAAAEPCQRCDAADPRLHHNASLLTDFHSEEESTWWQSQSMAFGIQHPNSVNITLHLGKAYEITYVRLKFHTSRPESFAIYKRGRPGGPWLPFQYYSASCERTYGTRPRQPLRPGDDERVAFCSDEFSDISPLSGGNVAFSTLEGRPSAYNFDGSPALQVRGGRGMRPAAGTAPPGMLGI
uniref:Laminin N-terminal domain-containing protein n=1 Tax=Nothoprocta perdicaria TaxID=30464 RepID=A0A8C7E8H4_NOTPE